jgi:hypothetical protein
LYVELVEISQGIKTFALKALLGKTISRFPEELN